MTDAPAMSPELRAERAERRRIRFNPFWLVLPGVAFLVWFMIVPAGQLIRFAIMPDGSLTAVHILKALSPGLYARVLGVTFSTALWTTFLCLLLGYPLALWLNRLGGRAQRLGGFCILLPFWTSALIKNFSWMVLLGRKGVFARMLDAIGLDWGGALLFTRPTVVLAMVHTMLPLAVITILPVLNQIDRRLSPAAETLGASRGQAFWLVTLPLSMRGVSAAGLLLFVASLGFFITPALLGGPKQMMIGQLIIMQIDQFQNWPLGSALAVVLVIAALVSCFVFDRIFGISSVTGGSEKARPPESRIRRLGLSLCAGMARAVEHLPKGRPWMLHLFAGVMIFLLLLPIFAFVPMAFNKTAYLDFPPHGFTLRWFGEFFASPLWRGAILRSFGIGVAVAAATLVIGGLAAAGIVRGRSKLSGAVFLLFITPLVVPPIALAVSIFALFSSMGLLATDTGIAIGHCVIALPIVFVVLLTTFKGYDWRLDDVALTMGASRLSVLMRVTLPLMKGGLVAGFITGFLQSFEELTVAIFVGGGLQTTLPKQMWDSILLQATPVVAAASVLVLAVVLVLFLTMEALQSGRTRRRGA